MATSVGSVQVETYGDGNHIVWAGNEEYALRKLTLLDQEMAIATPMTEVAVRQNWHARRVAIYEGGYEDSDFDRMVEKSCGLFGKYILTDREEENYIGLVEISFPGEDKDYDKRRDLGHSLAYDYETIYYRSANVIELDVELFDKRTSPCYFREAVKLALAAIDHFKSSKLSPSFGEVIYLIGDRDNFWKEFGESKVLEENGLKPIESYYVPLPGEEVQGIMQVHQKHYPA